MSAIKSSSGWFVFLFICQLQLSTCFAQSTENSVKAIEEREGQEHDCPYDYGHNETDYSDDEFSMSHPVARKPMKKPSDILLCHNLRGCECNGKHDRANCSCSVNGIRNRQQIVIGQSVTLPPNLREISIHDCPYVDISQTLLATFKIKSLIISQVNHLHIAPGTLKVVDQLVVKNIGILDYSDAFEQLEADTVTFSHVTFPVGAKFQPVSIKSQLDIVASNLTSFSMMVDSFPTDRSISIKTSILDRLSLKINAAIFTMEGNRFFDLPFSTAGLMDIAYSQSLNLKNNQFGTTPNDAIFLPNVMSSNPFFLFESKEAALSADSKRWLEHFKFEFTGATPGTRESKNVRTTCERQNTVDSGNYITSCPTVNTFVQLQVTEQSKSIATRSDKPQKERQVQLQGQPTEKPLNSNASVTKEHRELLLISIFTLMLFVLLMTGSGFTSNC